MMELDEERKQLPALAAEYGLILIPGMIGVKGPSFWHVEGSDAVRARVLSCWDWDKKPWKVRFYRGRDDTLIGEYEQLRPALKALVRHWTHGREDP